jgi:sulfur carrier protein ThiS adenylyltransferase
MSSIQRIANRYTRQDGLISQERISKIGCTIIGVGAIGRQVALQLSAIGAGNITLIDFDTVDVENLAVQGFLETDLQSPKVQAVKNLCTKINSEINIKMVNDQFKASDFQSSAVVFCCVDSIDTRKLIFNSIKDKCLLFIDGRMSAESFRIFTVFDERSKKWYPETIFPKTEAFVGSCTAKSTIYCSNICAGFMVGQFTKWLREIPLDTEINGNILTNEMDSRCLSNKS